jgi:hypothetical protein
LKFFVLTAQLMENFSDDPPPTQLKFSVLTTRSIEDFGDDPPTHSIEIFGDNS